MAVREAPPAASEPLSAEDLAILRLESPTVAGHTLKIAVLDPPHEEPRPNVEALRARITARIDRAPQLRRRVERRSNRRPVWVDDPGFDVRDHVRAVPVSDPISGAELRRICARMMEERLDRSRPLWTIDLLDPLEDGGTALVWRLHHSMADGAMAMRLAREVLWDEGDSAGRAAGAASSGALADLRESLRVRRPERLPGTLRRELARAREPSPLEGAVGAQRVVSFASTGLAQVRRAARTLVPGATVNDVILNLVAAGLRRWGESRGDPLGSLRVKIPVSLHHHSESPQAANRDSFFCVGLPIAVADSVERLRRIHRETALRKRGRDAQVLDILLRDMARVAPPLRRGLDRLLARPQAFALNVSNVIGPAHRPSVLGAPVRAFHSIADVDEGHGLRVAVISMADELHFGLCAEPSIVGSVDPLVEGLVAEAASISGRAP